MSLQVGRSPLRYESRSKLYEATGGTGGQMERDVCVFNRWREGGVGAVRGRCGGGAALGVRVDVLNSVRNHRRIWCSSQMFPVNLKGFPRPREHKQGADVCFCPLDIYMKY